MEKPDAKLVSIAELHKFQHLDILIINSDLI
jgi:hypothetical protein